MRNTKYDLSEALELSSEERKSVTEMLPPYVCNAIAEIPENLRLMDDRELRRHVRPNPTVQALRNSFWIEYARCIDKETKWLSISQIISGICSIEYWAQAVLKSPGLVEWVLRPPISYTRAMEEALYFGVEKVRDILDLPFKSTVIGKDGFEREVIDTKVAELVLKAFMIIDTRVKGSVIQRSEIKSLNVTASNNELRNAMEAQSMEELNKKLKELQKKEASLDMQTVEATVVEASTEEISP